MTTLNPPFFLARKPDNTYTGATAYQNINPIRHWSMESLNVTSQKPILLSEERKIARKAFVVTVSWQQANGKVIYNDAVV